MEKNIKLLSIGMNYSKIAGYCPGAELDASRIYRLVKDNCVWSNLLKNESATKENVISNMKTVCDSDLAIIFYAGHGASKKMKLNAPEEVDGNDEMICLYDNFMLDDEIWEIISKAKGRVFTIFDCCHSETMFRVTTKKSIWEKIKFWFDFKKKEENSDNQKSFDITPRTTEKLDLLCWSGCADDKTSVGGTNGGLFTNTILKYYDKRLSYDELWKKLSTDQSLNSREIVKQTILMGNESGFLNKNIFM